MSSVSVLRKKALFCINKKMENQMLEHMKQFDSPERFRIKWSQNNISSKLVSKHRLSSFTYTFLTAIVSFIFVMLETSELIGQSKSSKINLTSCVPNGYIHFRN